MRYNDLLGKTLIVTQARSTSGLTDKQKANLIGLGLNGINSFAQCLCTKDVLGMIKKVEHLIKISTK